MALVFSAIGWAVLYGAAYWVTMFWIVVVHGTDAQPPASFHWVFLACAGVLLVAATVDRWLFPYERAVDERPPVEHFLDVLLFIPRFTLMVWGNLSALVSLKRSDWEHAAALLDRLRIEGKVPLQQLPAQVPDETTRARILEALRVTQLIDLRKADNLTWLYLSPLAPEEFHRRAPDGESRQDDMAEMRRANMSERKNLPDKPAHDAEEGNEIHRSGESECGDA